MSISFFLQKTGKIYIRSTDNLEARLRHHNSGPTPSTKSGAPNWKIKFVETHPDKTSALKREIEIKHKKSRQYIEWLISSAPPVAY